MGLIYTQWIYRKDKDNIVIRIYTEGESAMCA